MANDRYVSSLESLTADAYYEAASAGAFNQKTADGQFAAFCLFYLTGSYQNLGLVSADSMFLWGNADETLNTGWSIQIGVSASQPILRVTTGSGLATTNHTASIGGFAYIERLIMAGLWVDDFRIAVTINGTIVYQNTQPTVAPSASPARLGYSPEGTNPATYAGIVAAGYSQSTVSLAEPRGIGLAAAQSFRAARGSLRGDQRSSSEDLDWTHRYEAYQLGQGQVGVVERNATSQVRLNGSLAPTGPLVDVGNTSFTPANVSPVNLLRQGSSTSFPFLGGIKNPDWYQGEGFIFLGEGPI